MKTQITTVEKLYKELERERASRQDLIADTRSLSVETTHGNSTLLVQTEDKMLSYPISDLAHRQIADRLKIPFAYYDRMRMEAPELLDQNINNWLYQNPEQRMLRILDGELRGLRRESNDLENNKIKVTHQLLSNSLVDHRLSKAEVDKLKEKALKTKSARDIKIANQADPFQPLKTNHSERTLDIDEKVKTELIEYLEYQDKYAAEHKDYNNEWNLLLTTSSGSPIDEVNFRDRHFRKVLNESGINKKLTPHKMRHTHASLLLKHGINIAVVSRRLGHADVTITYRTYVHVLPESSSEASNVWGDIISQKA